MSNGLFENPSESIRYEFEADHKIPGLRGEWVEFRSSLTKKESASIGIVGVQGMQPAAPGKSVDSGDFVEDEDGTRYEMTAEAIITRLAVWMVGASFSDFGGRSYPGKKAGRRLKTRWLGMMKTEAYDAIVEKLDEHVEFVTAGEESPAITDPKAGSSGATDPTTSESTLTQESAN